ncbi:MAG: hypothetical protein LBV44_02920 [Methylobacillus sp.]|nr:hypothetical protein [Methylobacillus sp.]
MASSKARQVKQREPAPRGRPESLITTLKAIAMIGLIGLGIVGLAITLFGENGVADDLFTRLMDPKSRVSIASLIVPVALVLILTYIIKNQVRRSSEKSLAEVLGSMAMYAMMCVGLYFLYHLITVGTLA